jgi:hypothetical protein
MAREHCLNVSTVLSFFAGGLMGLTIAVLMSPQGNEIKERIKSAVGRKEKLTREQIIEEGIQCAVPEGADICYTEQEEGT